MKKNKILILHIFITFFIFSCKNRDNTNRSESIAFINENFLTIVDTIAYKYNTLRPAPNARVVDSVSVFNISIYEKLISLVKWKSEILTEINKLDKNSESDGFIKILDDNLQDTSEYYIQNTSFSNTGKFNIILNKNLDIEKIKNRNIIGHIVISKVLFDKNKTKAITLTIVKDNIKSGIIKLLFFKRENSLWMKTNESVLEIW